MHMVHILLQDTTSSESMATTTSSEGMTTTTSGEGTTTTIALLRIGSCGNSKRVVFSLLINFHVGSKKPFLIYSGENHINFLVYIN